MPAPQHGFSGRMVELPGRGSCWVVDTGVPAEQPEAPVLMLLHGMVANAELNWGLHLSMLAQHYRVVMLDQRWHGRGIRCERFSLEDCADDVSALAGVLGIESYVAVGYSMGTAVAQLCWRRHREEVAGLVLGAGQTRWRVHRGEQAFYPLVAGAARAAGTGWTRRLGAASAAAAAHASTRSGRAWAARQLRESHPLGYAGVLAALGQFDSRSWIGEVDVPSCVIVTRHDWAVPPTRQRELAASIPGAQLVEVEGGHASVGVAPRRFGVALSRACDLVT